MRRRLRALRRLWRLARFLEDLNANVAYHALDGSMKFYARKGQTLRGWEQR